jgi:ferredoxin, 2Fe-2S
VARVTYIAVTGERKTVDAQAGESVMLTAIKNNVSGIDADCGGACACATCHVYVDSSWVHRLPPMSDMEKAMLDFAPGIKPNSRLSCQIEANGDLDGLIVELPRTQR